MRRNPLLFTAQPARVRPHRLETPACYLARLCRANVIDPHVVTAAITARRKQTGVGCQLGLVIQELGGPRPSHFARSFLAANPSRVTDDLDPARVLARAFRKQPAARYACTRCTAGQTVVTFEHHRFTVCTKHARWLAPGFGPDGQRQVSDPRVWAAAEHRYRRTSGSSFLDSRLIDATWRVLVDHVEQVDAGCAGALRRARDAPGLTPGVDDRAAVYPATARVLTLLADPVCWLVIDAYARAPGMLAAHLATRLDWATDPAGLATALTPVLLARRTATLPALRVVLGELVHAHPDACAALWGPTPPE